MGVWSLGSWNGVLIFNVHFALTRTIRLVLWYFLDLIVLMVRPWSDIQVSIPISPFPDFSPIAESKPWWFLNFRSLRIRNRNQYHTPFLSYKYWWIVTPYLLLRTGLPLPARLDINMADPSVEDQLLDILFTALKQLQWTKYANCEYDLVLGSFDILGLTKPSVSAAVVLLYYFCMWGIVFNLILYLHAIQWLPWAMKLKLYGYENRFPPGGFTFPSHYCSRGRILNGFLKFCL